MLLLVVVVQAVVRAPATRKHTRARTTYTHLQRRGADVQPQAVVAQRVVQIVHADISQRDAESLRLDFDRHYTGSMPLSA